MISEAKILKQAIEATALFQDVTLRPFREKVNYPAVYIYEVGAANMQASDTLGRVYNGPWSLSAQAFFELDKTLANSATTDYDSAQTTIDQLFDALFDTGDYTLTNIDFFTSTIAGKPLIVCNFTLERYSTIEYGS